MTEVVLGGNGPRQLAEVAARLKAAGPAGKRLDRQMRKALREAAQPVKDAIPEGAGLDLPQRGGLAARVASELGMSVSVRPGGASPTVKIRAKHSYDIRRMERDGRLRHPTYGHRPWVAQSVRAGWLERAAQAKAPEARRNVEAVLEDFARQIEQGGIT